MKTKKYRNITVPTAIWATVLLLTACSLGKIYIVTSTFSSKEL